MKQVIILMLLVAALSGGLLYAGGTVLAIGLGVLTLTTIILVAFALGGWWTARTMRLGAKLATEAASRNDQHDAVKIKALAQLTREAIKAKNQALPTEARYPALPPLPFESVEGTFTIAGLDEEETVEERSALAGQARPTATANDLGHF